MKEEEKYFDYKDEADKYVREQEKRGMRLLSVTFRQTNFSSFLFFGTLGYIYRFIWDK